MTIELIVMRLKDMKRVHPDQITARCSQCQHKVGVYPSGQKVMREHGDVVLICQICKTPGAKALLAPGALTETFESRKADDDDLKRRGDGAAEPGARRSL
jgi:hypothetical protein